MNELYHGWQIEVATESDGFSFQCWLPGNRLAVSDRKIYASIELARLAAQTRADTESAKWSLRRWYATCIEKRLHVDEVLSLEYLIVETLG
ncbi:hypothetical protein [Myxacorys almedinensis]|uniref:Uncharacterized protein n=1 Tax=Myxacorys almedinensis A TaxID=2690445 RepID=A0A8J8CNE1_9CYAN|nr:hypothetical protein [Myxacorys almedinensis]NDJ18332.1 hypothetical protein [Myxacorys almedinensis A]